MIALIKDHPIALSEVYYRLMGTLTSVESGSFIQSELLLYCTVVPVFDSGLPLSETTIAEGLKSVGYHTAIVGKWHLGVGVNQEYLPTKQGFDSYYVCRKVALTEVCMYSFSPPREFLTLTICVHVWCASTRTRGATTDVVQVS